ncbi:hypothetical protein LIER_43863 [Lithospermum erythrorhizon]|uniref:Bifunctional inhibitor/plant lipid transfer protein/seed storage helical domain-containing protein n=1 Tax=Lithospermum erythrorhizon TaxID=34254 RepID=A0AAV3R1S8_LITER
MKQHNILMLLLVLVLVILTVSSCSDELVRFSVCLPFVSASPNNLTDTPPLQCCAEFSSAQSLCLCYLLRPPPILAFPINSSRFFQLPSLCPNASIPHFSLDSLCSGDSVHSIFCIIIIPLIQFLHNYYSVAQMQNRNQTGVTFYWEI